MSGAALMKCACGECLRTAAGRALVDALATKEYTYVVIPKFDKRGNLPPGIHWATWDQICARFGTTEHRSELLEGLKRALYELKQAGCTTVYLDGSFVTADPKPGDYDACWEVSAVDPDKLDGILLDVEWRRDEIQAKYLGDFLPNLPRVPGRNVLSFFQRDRDDNEKGVIAIDLRKLP